MLGSLELPQVLQTILSELRRVVPYDSASVQELDGDQLTIVAGEGFPRPERILGLRLPLGAGEYPNLDEVVARRAPVVLDDAPRVYPGFLTAPHRDVRIRAWMGVPLLVGDRLIGIITLDSHQPGTFTPSHERVARNFAAHAALAI